ncbi:FHA domain-containing protein [Chloroflexi bacterium TSY]|nr:FHA domain-containing protein [Chloroflexi bacterium TSY]
MSCVSQLGSSHAVVDATFSSLPLTSSQQFPQLVLDSDASPPKSWSLHPTKPCTIGRCHTCDITLTDQRVSRYHARLCWQGGCYQIEDLESKNGTYLNGQPVERPTPLRHGDQCQIAICFILTFVNQEEAEVETTG